MILDTAKKCRSYRRFDNAAPITHEQLRSYVECARYTPSGANMQKLRFALFSDKCECDKIFETLKFAGYLKDWAGPTVTERPAAYIVICSEHELNTLLAIDLGITAEAIVLAAAEEGVGSCMIRSYNSDVISQLLPSGMAPQLVIALGYPTETVLVEDMVDGNVKYYRDELDRHIVPKRTLDELIIS